MFKILSAISILFSFATAAEQYQPFSKVHFDADIHEIQINADDLCQVSNNTLSYIEKYPDDQFAVHKGIVPSQVSFADVKRTLQFICDIAKQDVALNQNRLADVDFIKKNFDFYQWVPDKRTAGSWADKSKNEVKSRLLNNIPSNELFITKYYTKLLTGSAQKTDVFNQALYALPYDEAGLNIDEALIKKEELTRFKYTRQQVMSGILDKQKLAKPLIWLSSEALHDVLLQGTGVLEVDGKRRFFNVHRNNGISYDYTIGKREQARYWYFSEVPSIMGYGTDINNKIAIKPKATFAGNVKQLGLGKLFFINYQSKGKSVGQFGVLADQGGAFDNNLFQLDFLVGNYRGWNDYHQANKHLPDYAKTWLMLVKPKH